MKDLKQAFLKANQRILKPLSIDGLDEGFYIRSWNAAQRADILKTMLSFGTAEEIAENAVNGKALILATQFSLCDADGNRIFSDTEEDAKALEDLDGAVLQEIYMLALNLNGVGEQEEKQAIKNSETNPN